MIICGLLAAELAVTNDDSNLIIKPANLWTLLILQPTTLHSNPDVPALPQSPLSASKGLTFIPKPKSMNKMELYQDVQNFVRKLRLQYLMYDKPAKLPIPFQPKSKVNPGTTVNDTLETFIEKTKVELMSLDLKQNVKDNLTKNERIAL